jgi:predicted transcriptional regulator
VIPSDMADRADDELVATSVRLPGSVRKQLEEIAADERRPLGNLLRIAIEDWLELRETRTRRKSSRR